MTRILVSFDIDGTLEAGDPPGPVGDTSLDEHYATLAGFEFRYATDLPATPDAWLTDPSSRAT